MSLLSNINLDTNFLSLLSGGRLLVSNILPELLRNLPLFHDALLGKACLILADAEQVIGYLPGHKLDLGIRVGMRMTQFEGTVSVMAFRSGKKLHEHRGPEVFGMSYTSSATPIYDGDQVVGVFSVVMSNEKDDTLLRGATELTNSLQSATTSVEHLTNASHDVATRLGEVSEVSTQLSQHVESVHSILSFVKEISDQSHLLGLNAAIEAARAGETGRGFAVVAGEIRKMAERSKEAVTGIQDVLHSIQSSIVEIHEALNYLASYSEEQSASMHELNDSFVQIEHTAENLKQSVDHLG